jgi:hypothetical protein
MLNVYKLSLTVCLVIFSSLIFADPVVTGSPITPAIPITRNVPMGVPIFPQIFIPTTVIIQETVPPRSSGQDTFASLPVEALWAKISASNGNAIIGIKVLGKPRGVWKSARMISQAEVESYTNQIGAIAGVSLIVYRD